MSIPKLIVLSFFVGMITQNVLSAQSDSWLITPVTGYSYYSMKQTAGIDLDGVLVRPNSTLYGNVIYGLELRHSISDRFGVGVSVIDQGQFSFTYSVWDSDEVSSFRVSKYAAVHGREYQLTLSPEFRLLSHRAVSAHFRFGLGYSFTRLADKDPIRFANDRHPRTQEVVNAINQNPGENTFTYEPALRFQWRRFSVIARYTGKLTDSLTSRLETDIGQSVFINNREAYSILLGYGIPL